MLTARSLAPSDPHAVGPTLLDPQLEQALARDGYVVVPMLSAPDVAACRELWAATHQGEGSGFGTDFERLGVAERAELSHSLAPLLDRTLPRWFTGHRAFMSGFLTKWPGAGSELGLHQDWTYVDERHHRSVALWIALEDADTDLDNGPMQVLPGSHLLADAYRGPALPAWWAPLQERIEARMVTVPAKAGDAVIMDNRVLHRSDDNRSDRPRLALAGALIPAGANLVHVVPGPEGRVRVLAVDDAVFAANTPQTLAAGAADDQPLLGEAEQVQSVDADLLIELLGAEAGDLASAVAATSPGLGPSQPPSGGRSAAERALVRAQAHHHRRVVAVAGGDAGPFFDAGQLPWLADLEAAWPEIREEYDQSLAQRITSTPLELLTRADMGTTGAWSALMLRDNHGWVEVNRARFPETIRVLATIPGLRAAFFSVLDPGAEIHPHRGPNNGVVRAHLGVSVPGPAGACTLEVGDDRVAWRDGEAFAFDDTFEHRACNRTAEPRVSLMIEVDRPLPPSVQRTNQVVQRLFRLHPQARGSQQRIAELDAALNPGAGSVAGEVEP